MKNEKKASTQMELFTPCLPIAITFLKITKIFAQIKAQLLQKATALARRLKKTNFDVF